MLKRGLLYIPLDILCSNEIGIAVSGLCNA